MTDLNWNRYTAVDVDRDRDAPFTAQRPSWPDHRLMFRATTSMSIVLRFLGLSNPITVRPHYPALVDSLVCLIAASSSTSTIALYPLMVTASLQVIVQTILWIFTILGHREWLITVVTGSRSNLVH